MVEPPLDDNIETEITDSKIKTPPEHEGSDGRKQTRARNSFTRDFIKGMLIAVLLLGAKIGLEQTALGELLQTSTYNYLQLRLATPGTSDPLPVVVVDISELAPISLSTGAWNRTITPRPELLKLIDAIANQSAKAIGVDIDFAPDGPGYMWEDDPKFFESCLDISKRNGVPIFLGVRRSQDLAVESWLGSTQYKDLAGTIAVRSLDGRRVPKWTKKDADAEPGPSLSASLAKFLPESVNIGRSWTRHLIQQISESRDSNGKIVFGEFLVDYGLLELIRDKTLKTIKPLVIEDQGKWTLKNKLVLLGDATVGKSDTSLVPGQKEPVPGVYLHACAIYTLTHPLYELTGLARIVIDLTLSAFLVAIIAWIRVQARNGELNVSLLQEFLTLMVVLLAFVVGIIFVRRTRIMWDDFILVILVLFLHPSIEKWWHVFRNNIVPSIRTFFRN